MQYLAQITKFLSTLPNATLPDKPEQVEMFSSSRRTRPISYIDSLLSLLPARWYPPTYLLRVINSQSITLDCQNYRGTSNSLLTHVILSAPNAEY
jgi:hypothetical protein